ncbi:hypothetical protein BGX27_003601 [Mortierella sp. AM989]|nr:hypothetical protein BGX27_003601 [Mortierella sp. AM989]
MTWSLSVPSTLALVKHATCTNGLQLHLLAYNTSTTRRKAPSKPSGSEDPDNDPFRGQFEIDEDFELEDTFLDSENEDEDQGNEEGEQDEDQGNEEGEQDEEEESDAEGFGSKASSSMGGRRLPKRTASTIDDDTEERYRTHPWAATGSKGHDQHQCCVAQDTAHGLGWHYELINLPKSPRRWHKYD